MENRKVYLDNAATTRVRPEVLEAMLPWFTENFGNASSVHSYGRTAQRAVDEAREKVAKALGATASEIYFTSGGTEADNWAIKGFALKHQDKGKHIITSAIEHHAVLHTFNALKKQGFEMTLLPVDEFGTVKPETLKAAMRPDTILVSIMMANNEIGTIEPIAELAKIAKAGGAAFHTDAVQAVGHIPVDVKELGVDMLTLSAHKFHGPKGIGALYIRKGVSLDNLIDGGAHERGRRAGTTNHPGIIGLAKALELSIAEMPETSSADNRIAGQAHQRRAGGRAESPPERPPREQAAGQRQLQLLRHGGRGAGAEPGYRGHRRLQRLGLLLRFAGALARADGHRHTHRSGALVAQADTRRGHQRGRH